MCFLVSHCDMACGGGALLTAVTARLAPTVTAVTAPVHRDNIGERQPQQAGHTERTSPHMGGRGGVHRGGRGCRLQGVGACRGWGAEGGVGLQGVGWGLGHRYNRVNTFQKVCVRIN